MTVKQILENLTPEIKKEMETIWFTADLHQGHPKIIPICNRPVYFDRENELYFKERLGADYHTKPWADKEWRDAMNKVHDQWLVKEVFNKWVGKRDTVFILGDLSMAKRQEAEKFVDRLNGNKTLIEGNHDGTLKNSTRFAQITQIKEYRFKRPGIEIRIDLCHYPMASWPSKPKGGWQLYGHVHGRYKNKGLSMDVGIDNPEINWRPINLYELALLMREKEKEFGEGVYYDNGLDGID
jgi:calcineurin-like phosphoesterase family protein